MKKIRKISIVSLLMLALLVTGILAPMASAAELEPYGTDATTWMVGNEDERIDTVEVAGRDCFVFVPESPKVGNLLNLTPVVIVCGDEAWTEESVQDAVDNLGFGEIGRANGVCIVFANPIEAWGSEADAAAADALHQGIMDLFTSRPELTFVNGVASGEIVVKDWFGNVNAEQSAALTEKFAGRYPGSIHGFQFFGEGAGADFIAANWLKDNPYDINYANQAFGIGAENPTGVALFCPTEIPMNPIDAHNVIPMAVVNGPADAGVAVASYNQPYGYGLVLNEEGVTGFDKDLVTYLYDEVVDKYYLTQTEFRPFPNYDKRGDKSLIEYYETVVASSGNNVRCFMYIPVTADLADIDSIPMVVWCHGMGGEGEAMESFGGWTEVASETQEFIVLSIDQHTGNSADDVMDAVDYMLARIPAIDDTRLYMAGFSMGSMKTWQTAVPNWNRFAGINPCAATTSADLSTLPEGAILPTFYVSGYLSASEYGPRAASMMQLLYHLNAIKGDYEAFDAEANPYWGAAGSKTIVKHFVDDAVYASIASAVQFNQTTVIEEYTSDDGNVYTWMSVNLFKPHYLTPSNAFFAWEQLRVFSRGADGVLYKNGVAMTEPIIETEPEVEAPISSDALTVRNLSRLLK